MRLLFVVGLWMTCGCVVAAAWVPAGVVCAPTAEAAVARILGHESSLNDVKGYKVVALRTDALRQTRWAMVASCADASRPMVAIQLVGDFVPVIPKVRLGDKVSVVSGSGDSRMELTGWAEDGGAEKDVIRVRLAKFSSDEDAVAAVIHCSVVGPGVVEVVR